MTMERVHVKGDWYAGGIPSNVVIGRDVYIDTSHAFAAFHSRQQPGLTLGEAAGVYDRAILIVGPDGRVTVGAYTCLNGASLICQQQITIGQHCFLAWGCVITDTWLTPTTDVVSRRAQLRTASLDSERQLQPGGLTKSVVLEDNVWVGFDTVILPGVRLGQGCVVGCKTVVQESVPPYAVVVGTPPRIIRYLDSDDTEEVRRHALEECRRA